jgi:hypothetical protein
VIASRLDAGQSSCHSGLAGASDSEASWLAGGPDERKRSLSELAAVLLLVDSLLRCSLDASVVVTDASILEVCICIRLLLGGARTNGCWSCRSGS